jgi:hexosaminidase
MIHLIPYPQEIIEPEARIQIKLPISLHFSSDLEPIAILMLKTLRSDWNCEFPTIMTPASALSEQKDQSLVLKLDPSLKRENYVLTITDHEITIEGGNAAGIFYGFQTLRQIFFNYFSPGKLSNTIPCFRISDGPRFGWRGFMLDEARYFLGKDAVKKIFDWMGLLKFNRFHWHLTDDQGWRIEIPSYPKLTQIGSHRKGTPKYRNLNTSIDGVSHSGYYTQEDIRELVAYARDRFIEIIPEIEMPGHAVAALAAYPEFSCTGGPFEIDAFWGVHKDVFCPGNPQTIEFLQTILKEILPLFPAPWIHIGGDEVPKNRWKSCPKCQNRIRTEQLTDEHHLQVVFTNEMVEFLAQLGKQTIVWNEVTDSRLDPQIVTQFWRGKFESITDFLKLGGRTIVSPSREYYVDVVYQILPLKRCYTHEPVPDTIEQPLRPQILGVEAEMWGEVFKSVEKMEYCAFPRTFAIAESAWTGSEKKDYDRFLANIPFFYALWKKFGINYAPLHDADPSKWTSLKLRFTKGFGTYL